MTTGLRQREGEKQMRLQGKVVVITGAGSGLGRESAQLFSREGARVVLADIDTHRVETSAKLVEGAGGDAIAVTADVRDEAQVAAAVDTAVREFGQLDVMFANAGVITEGYGTIPIDELTSEAWHDVMEVNTTGVFYA